MYEHRSTKSVKISMRHFYPRYIGETLPKRRRKNAPAESGVDYATLYRYKTVQKSPLFLHANCY